MNAADLVVAGVIIALVAVALWLMRRSQAKGRCGSCPYAGSCERHH